MLHQWLMLSPTPIPHPIFQINMRRLRWWRNGRTPSLYGAEVVVWTVLLLLISWVFFLVARYAVYSTNATAFRSIYRLTDGNWTLLLWSGGISIALSYLLDFAIMALTVNSINGERNALRWDLVQLTPLSGQSVLTALHGASMLRLWRMTMIVIGTRVAVVLAILLNGFFVEPVLRDESLLRMWYDIVEYPMETAYLVLLCMLLGAVFILEPLWRLQATTAIAMGVSAQVRRFVTAITLAFLMMVLVWILMAALAAGGIWLLVWTTDRLYNIVGYDNSAEMFVILVTVGGFTLEAAFVYHSFRLIRAGGLRWALRRTSTIQERWVAPPRPDGYPWWNGLRWWLPHSGIQPGNPLFDFHVRQVGWWQSDRSPVLRWWLLAAWTSFAVLLVSAVGYVALAWASADAMSDADALVGLMEQGAWWAVLVGLIMVTMLDLPASGAAARAVTALQVRVDDDLLALTNLRPKQLVEAFRALARLQAWAVVTVSVVFASLAVVMYFSLHFAEWYITDSIRLLPDWRWIFLTERAPMMVSLLLLIMAMGLIKTRTVTAVTLALVLRLRGVRRTLARGSIELPLFLIQVLGLIFFGLGAWNRGSSIYDEWGTVLGATVLLILFLLAVEQIALADARRFARRLNKR